MLSPPDADGALTAGTRARAAQRFRPGPALDEGHFYSSATRLTDDTVLIAVGYTSRIQPTGKAWLLRVPARSP
jgi:hypothetical protein